MASRPTKPSNCFIYGLHEYGQPDTIRYVGKTTRGRERIRGHEAMRGRPGHCLYWIKSLYARGSRLAFRVLEFGAPEKLCDLERAWIARLKSEGHSLTNMTDGGEGTFGRKITAEFCQRMREVAKNRPPLTAEARARMSAAQRGRSMPPEVRAKIGAAHRGKKRPPDCGAKISRSKMGHEVRSDVRERLAEAQRGKKHSLETRAKMRASAQRGEKSSTAKLTVADVLAIRRAGTTGRQHRDIARDFPVSQVMVSRIIRRAAWAHVPEEHEQRSASASSEPSSCVQE